MASSPITSHAAKPRLRKLDPAVAMRVSPGSSFTSGGIVARTRLFGGQGSDERGQLPGIGVERTDAFGQLLGRHRVLVVLPAEGCLVERRTLQVAGLRTGHRKPCRNTPRGRLELLQQVR